MAQADGLAGIVFPQVNSLGCLEDVDGLTELAHRLGARAIVVTDPMLLATGGLKAPGTFGAGGEGADILVGEAQHLAIPRTMGDQGWESLAFATMRRISKTFARPGALRR